VEVDLLSGPERVPVSPVAPALEARRVSKVFVGRAGEATLALRDVGLEVQRGTFVSLIGPSGCGKSTLLRILGGLEQPSTGEVRSTTRQERGGLPAVAFVFQDYGLFPWLSVVDNVAFGLRMAGMGKRERHDRARAWLARMGLAGFERSYPEQLSGGMRQRLSLARAFVTDPEVLLMDEPMAALDAQTRLLLQEDLVRLWEETKKTVVLVTHSLDEALLLGDRVVVMTARPGRVKLDLPVGLPRPRNASSATGVAFSRMKADLWAALRDEVEKSLEHS
jgi:NitT/TauT family transport system ATP-binding protein